MTPEGPEHVKCTHNFHTGNAFAYRFDLEVSRSVGGDVYVIKVEEGCVLFHHLHDQE
jgi:hypothetical protein